MAIFDTMTFFETIFQQYQTYPSYLIIIESLAVLFGLLSVYFSIKKNILVYPTGLINTLLFIYIMYVFGLLGDMLINVYYSIMSIYGWMLWSKNSGNSLHIESKNANKQEWQTASFLFIISSISFGLVYYFKPIIDGLISNTENIAGLHHLDWANYTDIFTSSLFLVGMYFMAKRNVENWIFWIIADFICIPMMFYKGLGFTTIQYIIFTIMAIIGYIEWRKSVKVG